MSEDHPDAESRLVVTRDGSHTVYSSRFDQHYHNPNGAIAESRYVFFEQTGLLDDLAKTDTITIFETGFGTGLNFLLLVEYYLECGSKAEINYYSIEGFPLAAETAADLNYDHYLNHANRLPDISGIFNNLDDGMNHFTYWDNINLHLYHGLFNDFPSQNIGAQYIFHDAFSPDVNPDLWTGEVFNKIKALSTDEVILSTYCAASKARGALCWAGWKVARSRGALGKREMTLAALHENRLDTLDRVNEKRLARRYEEDDF